MNVCIDVGNTTIAFGIYENNKNIHNVTAHYGLSFIKEQFLTLIKENLDIIKDYSKVKNVILSSVVPEINKELLKAIKELFNLDAMRIEIGKTNVGFKFNIDNPMETGEDLVADLAGAISKYSYPILIVDLGTATKFLYIDELGEFSSANILPGMKLCRNSLSKDTSLLPKIELHEPKSVIGKNTIDAMNTGLMYGHVDMVEGMIKRYQKELNKDIKVVVTGGNLPLLKNMMNSNYIYDSDLTLDGLNYIINLNK